MGMTAVSAIGGIMSASSAGDAADVQAGAASSAANAQLQATREANQLQRDIYNQNRADIAPWRNTGVSALNALSDYLGLNPVSQYTGTSPFQARSLDQIMASLRASGNYNLPAQQITNISQLDGGGGHETGREGGGGGGMHNWFQSTAQANGGGFNNALLQTDAQRIYQQEQARQQQEAQARADETVNFATRTKSANFGQGMRDFAMSDLYADPVWQASYQTGLDEGRNALERRQLAAGGFDSGAALKELTRFGGDYANQKAGESYNRYNANKVQKYNFLSGVAGLGQNAANTQVGLGQNYANAVGSNTIGGAANASNALLSGANATAAGIVGSANALNQGFSNALNAYQQNQYNQQYGMTPSYGGGYNVPGSANSLLGSYR